MCGHISEIVAKFWGQKRSIIVNRFLLFNMVNPYWTCCKICVGNLSPSSEITDCMDSYRNGGISSVQICNSKFDCTSMHPGLKHRTSYFATPLLLLPPPLFFFSFYKHTLPVMCAWLESVSSPGKPITKLFNQCYLGLPTNSQLKVSRWEEA